MPEATGTDSTLVDLTEKLDSLLERYLYLLDEYTSARKALGQDLCDVRLAFCLTLCGYWLNICRDILVLPQPTSRRLGGTVKISTMSG